MSRVFPTRSARSWSSTGISGHGIEERELNKIWILRKFLNDRSPQEAMEFLLDKLAKTETNTKFLESMNG